MPNVSLFTGTDYPLASVRLSCYPLADANHLRSLCPDVPLCRPAGGVAVEIAVLVAELRAPFGVYGVIGNHDYPSGYRDWLRFLRSCGIRMRVNEHAPLGDGLTMAGVNDPMAEWNHEEAPNLPKALAGAPADRPVVLLAHVPVFADTAAKDKRVSLQLSGHTHGGLFPGLSALVARSNGGYVNGLYRVGSMPLYVSPGTSLRSGMPVRLFFCRKKS